MVAEKTTVSVVLILNVECSCKNVSFNNGSHKSETSTLPDPQLSTKDSEASGICTLPEIVVYEVDENDKYGDSKDFFSQFARRVSVSSSLTGFNIQPTHRTWKMGIA